MSEQSSPVSTVPKFERVEDFVSAYADNARFEATVFNLKMIFGEIDLSSGTEVVKQHTSITLPWALVKLVVFYLQINILLHEAQIGKITVPPNQAPPAMPEMSEVADVPQALIDSVKRLREQFIASM